jgi:FlaA1/EpsC-like NDP-sugar epimerase
MGKILKKRRRCLILGGGRVGSAVLLSMLNHPEEGWQPVGVIAEREEGANYIFGIPVFIGLDKIKSKFSRLKAEEIIVAEDTQDAKKLLFIINFIRGLGVRLKIFPASCLPSDSREADLAYIREVNPEDLLQKSTLSIPWKEYCSYLKENNILVTGAAGSIGLTLVKLIEENFSPSSIILVDKDENGVAYLTTLFRGKENIHIILADIQDRERIMNIFSKFLPKIVFHTAAYKHLPLMESAPQEAVKNNIWATKILLEAAEGANSHKFILASTDKAANPTSIMGATKRFAELLLISYQQKLRNEGKSLKVAAVRFSNVIGSRGSVIPLFLEQIKKGGPVTVTHPEVRRYFMTPEQACQLILLVSTLIETGGEIFALDFGEEINILQLAESLITLSGYSPYEEIPIEIIGLRKGEKLKEELKSKSEEVKPTLFPKIWRLEINDRLYTINSEDIILTVEELYKEAKEERIDGIIKGLKRIVPDLTLS